MTVLTHPLPKYIHSRLIPLIESESYFQLIRSNILKRTTATELEVAARIAKATDHHDMGTIDASSAVSTKRKQNSKWDNNLIIHYTHEKRFETLKKDIHQLWNQIFHNTPIMNTKLIIGHKNNNSATRELIQRRPHHMPKLIYTNQSKQTSSLDINKGQHS